MTIDAKTSAAVKPKITRVEVYWHTVKYRTVVLYAFVAVAIVLAIVYLAFPDFSNGVLRRITAASGSPDSGVANPSSRQARFVNLDGKVQVKKVNSVQWVNADYQVTLDKGDLIQTDSEGVARMAFADGTTYTAKGDTLGTGEKILGGRITRRRGGTRNVPPRRSDYEIAGAGAAAAGDAAEPAADHRGRSETRSGAFFVEPGSDGEDVSIS